MPRNCVYVKIRIFLKNGDELKEQDSIQSSNNGSTKRIPVNSKIRERAEHLQFYVTLKTLGNSFYKVKRFVLNVYDKLCRYCVHSSCDYSWYRTTS